MHIAKHNEKGSSFTATTNPQDQNCHVKGITVRAVIPEPVVENGETTNPISTLNVTLHFKPNSGVNVDELQDKIIEENNASLLAFLGQGQALDYTPSNRAREVNAKRNSMTFEFDSVLKLDLMLDWLKRDCHIELSDAERTDFVKACQAAAHLPDAPNFGPSVELKGALDASAVMGGAEIHSRAANLVRSRIIQLTDGVKR